MEVFSTITSPWFSEFVLVLGDDEIAHLPSDVTLFKTLRTMSEVRPFRLVFLLAAPDRLLHEARQKLVEALDLVRAQGFLDFLPPRRRAVQHNPKTQDGRPGTDRATIPKIVEL